tara:strand:- start:76 stop:483 length:408 start_codon:yes stop_codon:yes gene_type:complete
VDRIEQKIQSAVRTRVLIFFSLSSSLPFSLPVFFSFLSPLFLSLFSAGPNPCADIFLFWWWWWVLLGALAFVGVCCGFLLWVCGFVGVCCRLGFCCGLVWRLALLGLVGDLVVVTCVCLMCVLGVCVCVVAGVLV